MWMRNLEKVLISYEGDKRVKGLLEYCVSRPQVPRKRKKFISFAASTCQEPDVEIAKEVWNILDGSKYNRIICNGINLGRSISLVTFFIQIYNFFLSVLRNQVS